MKTIHILAATLLCGMFFPVVAQERTHVLSVTVENSWTENKYNEPVVISLREKTLPFIVQSAIVRHGEEVLPSQLDDLNRDGQADELAFLVDIPAKSQQEFTVTLSEAASTRNYPPQVYAQMKLNDKGGKTPQINYLSVPGTTAPKETYSALYHHGPAFESELVAYRIYFDNRQSIDIYGKRYKQLELQKSNYYSSPELRAQGYGNDVLWAGKTVSVGSFRGWEKDSPQYIDDVKQRSLGILAYGPVRTVIEVADQGWGYQGSRLDMTQHYTLYAHHRDVEVNVHFAQPQAANHTFCTGVMKVEEENIGFLQPDGLAGSWGTNLPEKTDTIHNPRETVGLGVYVPAQYVRRTVENTENYLVLLHTAGTQDLTYHLTFCTKKEEKDHWKSDTWFAYLAQWQQALQHPCRVTLKDASKNK